MLKRKYEKLKQNQMPNQSFRASVKVANWIFFAFQNKNRAADCDPICFSYGQEQIL